jgi:ribonuclease Z
VTVRDLTILGCASQQPTRLRNHGAYLLRWNEEGLLFDPGEGTQRQFIFANVAPPTVTRIFVSHFHGDHCLGLGSMLMRLNLDKVTHPIHVYYPASGKVYFDRLRYGTAYHEQIKVIEHPVHHTGLVHEDENFRIEAYALEHGIENYAYRIQETPRRRFYKEKLKEAGIDGFYVRDLLEKGSVEIHGQRYYLKDFSSLQPGSIFSCVLDTKFCQNAIMAARDADLLLCESTYLDAEKTLAENHNHLTATQAAVIAKEANAKMLILTHFSARYLDLSEFEKEAQKVFPNSFAADDLKVFPFRKTIVNP